MDLTLLSGVVRNRKQMASAVSRSHILFDEGQTESQVPHNTIDRLRTYFSKNSIFRKFSLRVHKFTFQWELAIHLFICILSLTPFFFTGRRLYSLIPISVWAFYNVLFLAGPQFSNKVIPRFGKLKLSFKSTIEEFFSAKLLPVLSISFLCVVLSLAVTGHRLGGPPLCYQPCGVCLATWKHSIPLPATLAPVLSTTSTTSGAAGVGVSGGSSAGGGAAAAVASLSARLLQAEMTPQEVPYHPLSAGVAMEGVTIDPAVDAYRIGCGYANGKEMLGYYTMGQTSFILFFVVVVALTVCLAWRVADEERQERRSAEEWLKTENLHAYQLRTQLVEQLGPPGSSVRPEGSATWIFFGVTAALTFTLLGWHNWYVLPPSNTATLLIILNLLTILMSTLILHLSFFGRLLALYKRNLNRVECLSKILSTTAKEQLDSWWSCRNFVLNDDLSLDYDIGGLAVSATFLIAITLFAALITQIYREGLQAMLEPPGSYLAYACMYITCCLIKLFTLATNTYEEQHRHIAVLQGVSNGLHYQGSMSTDYNEYAELKNPGTTSGNARSSNRIAEANHLWAAASEDDYLGLQDDGPICIEDDDIVVGGSAGSAGSGAGSGGVCGTDKPPLSRNSSGTGSPRRTKMKSFLSSSSEDKSGDKHPAGILRPTSSGGSPLMSNWLGKAIFSSFRVGFEDAASGEDGGEKEALLAALQAPPTGTDAISGAVMQESSGGSGGNSGAGVGVGMGVGGLRPSSSGAKLSSGGGGGAGLPRPHNQQGRGLDAKGAPLQIDTLPSQDTLPTLSHNTTISAAAGAGAGAGTSTTAASAGASGGAGEPAGVVKISPFGSIKSPHFALEPPTLGLGTRDSFAGINVNTPETDLGDKHSALLGGESANPNSLGVDSNGGGGGGGAGAGGSGVGSASGSPSRPALIRSVSHNASVESYRQTIAEMISQIRRYDPYPCILGIPVMPALFNSSKFYIFIGFMLIGMRVMVACLRQI